MHARRGGRELDPAHAALTVAAMLGAWVGEGMSALLDMIAAQMKCVQIGPIKSPVAAGELDGAGACTQAVRSRQQWQDPEPAGSYFEVGV